ATGSAKYYSPNNELKGIGNGFNPNNYIPNSEGPVSGQAYPFTETRFSPDGRIAAQGGVGLTYQLGSGHETKYFYESPAQEELDALFGTDAGLASHYFKNLVKDANGQYSVSYTDLHGRIVATALAGDVPRNSGGGNMLDPLASLNTKTFTKQLIDAETNLIIGKSIISSKPLIVPKAGSYEFNYQLNPDQLKLASCNNNQICYDCLYNLKITINSDCNGVAGFPYTVVDSNFTVGGLLTAPVCNTNGKSTGYFNNLFSVTLPEGAYSITKTLSLSDSAQTIYRDVFTNNDTCKKFIDFYNEAYQVLQTKSNCAITCSACDSAIGHNLAGFIANFVLQDSLQLPLSDSMVTALTAAYNNARANCDRICNYVVDDGMENIRNIQQLMLLDVSPTGGQYANPDSTAMYNIFYSAAYQNPISHVWNSGQTTNDVVFKNEIGQTFPIPASVQDFTTKFQSSWAQQLLPHHPEYCKLQTTMEQLPSTYRFEADLNKLNTWSDMIAATPTSGQYVTNIVDNDPFFSNTGGNAPGSAYYTAMKNSITNYAHLVSGGIDRGYASLWQIAQSTVFCRNSDTMGGINSAQSQCLLNTPVTPSINPTTGCANDWDMIWKNFRSLYLSKRQEFISKYLKDQCPGINNNSIILQGKTPRFVDFSNNNGMSDIDAGGLNTFFNQLGNSDPASTQTAHSLLQSQYDSTCTGYANT
ncbi:MAG: hypothetical protein M3R72_09250, partial [Bacteroidota bacterium]|nr:hypothetical protein [Bacteroidota bacterium]